MIKKGTRVICTIDNKKGTVSGNGTDTRGRAVNPDMFIVDFDDGSSSACIRSVLKEIPWWKSLFSK